MASRTSVFSRFWTGFATVHVGEEFYASTVVEIDQEDSKNDKYTGFGGIQVCGLRLVSLFDLVFEGVIPEISNPNVLSPV